MVSVAVATSQLLIQTPTDNLDIASDIISAVPRAMDRGDFPWVLRQMPTNLGDRPLQELVTGETAGDPSVSRMPSVWVATSPLHAVPHPRGPSFGRCGPPLCRSRLTRTTPTVQPIQCLSMGMETVR